jgi:hypothetical protein
MKISEIKHYICFYGKLVKQYSKNENDINIYFLAKDDLKKYLNMYRKYYNDKQSGFSKNQYEFYWKYNSL